MKLFNLFLLLNRWRKDSKCLINSELVMCNTFLFLTVWKLQGPFIRKSVIRQIFLDYLMPFLTTKVINISLNHYEKEKK